MKTDHGILVLVIILVLGLLLGLASESSTNSSLRRENVNLGKTTESLIKANKSLNKQLLEKDSLLQAEKRKRTVYHIGK